MLQVIVLASLCVGQTYDVKAAAPRYVVSVGELPTKLPSFAAARAEALATGKDLVVGLQCDPPSGEWVSGRSEKPFLKNASQWAGTVAVLKNRGTWFEWLDTVPGSGGQFEAVFGAMPWSAENIRSILLPPDPRFEREKSAPDFPRKYNPAADENYQRLLNQRRIRRQTSNLRLIAPRYAGSC